MDLLREHQVQFAGRLLCPACRVYLRKVKEDNEALQEAWRNKQSRMFEKDSQGFYKDAESPTPPFEPAHAALSEEEVSELS